MALARVEDLVYVHSNLQLLSRRNEEYVNTTIKMWDIARDTWNELEFLRMQPLHLMSQSWRLWLLGMLTLVLLLVKVKFEVKLLILMMKKLVFDCLVDCLIDCLIDYLLFSFSFKLVGCV